MRVRVLGSGAGGGFPQWNCNCSNCARMRRGEIRATPRTQSSIAIGGDGENWVLCNASPDIRNQLESFPEIQPRRAVRDTGIAAIVLLDSQIDHTAGLLALREGQALQVYCTHMVYEDLTSGLPVLKMLGHYCGVEHHPVPLEDGAFFTIPTVSGLRFRGVPLTSKAPPYSPHRHDPHLGDNLGLYVEDLGSGGALFYAPGLGEIEPHVREVLEACDCVLLDGTFWREDEMAWAGVGTKLASEMGHLPLSGEGGMIAELRTVARPRKVLIHVNNTNPILDEESQQRAELTAEGIEVSYDGMEILL